MENGLEAGTGCYADTGLHTTLGWCRLLQYKIIHNTRPTSVHWERQRGTQVGTGEGKKTRAVSSSLFPTLSWHTVGVRLWIIVFSSGNNWNMMNCYFQWVSSVYWRCAVQMPVQRPLLCNWWVTSCNKRILHRLSVTVTCLGPQVFLF